MFDRLKQSYTRIPAIGFALVVLASVLVTAPVSAQDDVERTTDIDSCVTIDEPGRYVLTGDIDDDDADVCIDIQSSDVRFDGNGHTIARADRSGTAVRVDGDDVTLTDLVVTGWAVGVGGANDIQSLTITDSLLKDNRVGIELTTANLDVVIRENTVTMNDRGVFAQEAEDVLIEENLIQSNRLGILLDFTTVTIANNTIRSNEGDGISSNEGGLIVESNEIVSNEGDGISTFWTGTTARHNVIRENRNGIILSSPVFMNEIIANEISSNREDGVIVEGGIPERLPDDFEGVEIRANVVATNEQRGIVFREDGFGDRANRHIVRHNLLYRNGDDGISLQNGSSNRLVGNILIDNDDGIALQNADRNTLLGNLVASNEDDGISLRNADRNRLVINVVVRNGGSGIHVVDSDGNRLLYNIVVGNDESNVRIDADSTDTSRRG